MLRLLGPEIPSFAWPTRPHLGLCRQGAQDNQYVHDAEDPSMKRAAGALAAGLVMWLLIATLLNWLLRLGLPGYAMAEHSMTFTLPMQIARLLTGALASIGAGYVAARITPVNPRPPLALGVLLLLLFIPVHYGVWDKFPVWYHAVFLISLVPLVMAGARTARRSNHAPPPASHPAA